MVTLIFVCVICLLMKLRFKLKLFGSVKEGLLVMGALFVIGCVWDNFAILRGYWAYKEEFFVGIKFGVMPLEEYLFVLVIPFLTLTIYSLVRHRNAR